MTTEDELMRLFKQPYQRDNWLRMLGERLLINQFSCPISIKGDAKAFFQLGKVSLADNKELGIYEIQTTPETRLHRNRVEMRQLVAKQCQQSTLDGALAVYDDNSGNWRFSFISVEYKLNDQGQINRQESASKRFTYLLGNNAKVRTAVERFSRLNKTATLDDLKSAFAVEQLNKEFYENLFEWYEKAKSQVVFPNDEREEKDKHASISLIRLLTRLLFVWFLKEKGLINRNFFEFDKVRQMIDWSKESGYYKAILQNLFFATLNREITDRTFRTTTNGKPNSNNYLVAHVYRYENIFLLQDKNAILRLFEQTPFLNGGLFECLDREANEDERQGHDKDGTIRKEKLAIRVDGFSDREDNVLDVPNNLFFNKDEKQLRLITLLNRYQFTVEESTPLDADVALDPELLGLVFENLLASYNPETRQTARKASGSYYTPREIVTYMVDESLKAHFAQATDIADPKISRLFHTACAENDLTENEAASLISAIDTIKIIDPAVGSGAFPMGILQRLVQILGIVDPENKQWKQRQTDIIDKLPDPESREQALKEVETIFSKENRFNDFGRKLYLIEKCIYGVDIQPIACQIAKLRFFISLAIEQEPTDDAEDNYGIKPLPNLETKFVAADTLLALEKPNQLTLGQTNTVPSLEKELTANRERYFHATSRSTKRNYRDKDKQLRDRLAAALQEAGFPTHAVDKIANWAPYDQNASADWFDAEYMFGVTKGFDVVIGNPPYIQLQKNGGRLGWLYKDAGYETFARTGDIYQLFYEKGCRLLTPQRGLLCYITSDSWLNTEYGKPLRRYFSERHTPLRLMVIGEGTFTNAIVNTSILTAGHGKSEENGKAVDMNRLADKDFPPDASLWLPFCPQGERPWSVISAIEQPIMDKMESVGTPLKDWDVSIYYGIKTGYNDAFIIDGATKQALVAKDLRSAEILKPVLRRGHDVQRYLAKYTGWWLIDTHNGYGDVPAINIDDYPAVKSHLDRFYPRLEKRQDKGKTPYNLRNCAYHKEFTREKLVWLDLTQKGRFAYDDSGIYCEATTFLMTGENIKYLCTVLNSGLIAWFMKNTAPTGMGMHPRWKKVYVERLPIPNIPANEQHPFIRLVDCILSAKSANPSADTTEQEAEIDRLVYGLYGLTSEEIATVERI